MKLFEVIIKKKHAPEDTKPGMPFLLVAHNATEASKKVKEYWDKKDWSITRPNMIADFNPK